MGRRLAVWLAAGFVLVPIALAAAALGGCLPADGGHGLGLWMLLGCCGVAVLLGTVLATVLAVRGTGSRWTSLLAWIGGAALLLLFAAYGLPFAR